MAHALSHSVFKSVSASCTVGLATLLVVASVLTSIAVVPCYLIDPMFLTERMYASKYDKGSWNLLHRSVNRCKYNGLIATRTVDTEPISTFLERTAIVSGHAPHKIMMYPHSYGQNYTMYPPFELAQSHEISLRRAAIDASWSRVSPRYIDRVETRMPLHHSLEKVAGLVIHDRIGFPFRWLSSETVLYAYTKDPPHFGSEVNGGWPFNAHTDPWDHIRHAPGGLATWRTIPYTINWLTFPLNVLIWCAFYFALYTLFLLARSAWRIRKNACPACGYSLAGLTNHTSCPECGHGTSIVA